MMDPIQAMFAAGAIPTESLPATSRYRDVGTAEHGEPANAVAYFRRRFVPPPERHSLLHFVQVREGDRRDLLSHAHLGDAALWWQLADANGVLEPRDLERPAGRWIRVTLPHEPRPQGRSSAEGGDDA